MTLKDITLKGLTKMGFIRLQASIWSPGGFDVYVDSIKLGGYVSTYHKFRGMSPNFWKYEPHFNEKISK